MTLHAAKLVPTITPTSIRFCAIAPLLTEKQNNIKTTSGCDFAEPVDIQFLKFIQYDSTHSLLVRQR